MFRDEWNKRKELRRRMIKELEDEKVRITLLEARKEEREKRIKQRILRQEKVSTLVSNFCVEKQRI